MTSFLRLPAGIIAPLCNFLTVHMQKQKIPAVMHWTVLQITHVSFRNKSVKSVQWPKWVWKRFFDNKNYDFTVRRQKRKKKSSRLGRGLVPTWMTWHDRGRRVVFFYFAWLDAPLGTSKSSFLSTMVLKFVITIYNIFASLLIRKPYLLSPPIRIGFQSPLGASERQACLPTRCSVLFSSPLPFRCSRNFWHLGTFAIWNGPL